MILILSNSFDFTTYLVAKSIERSGGKCIVLSETDLITGITISNSDICLRTEKHKFYFSELSAYWYRRGDFVFKTDVQESLPEELKNTSKEEISHIKNILHSVLLTIPHLGSLFNADLNRVTTLNFAQSLQLKVPAYSIINSKSVLRNFIKDHKSIIVKPIGNGLTFIKEDNFFVNYTSLFDNRDLINLSENFAPSLFMKYIDKKYEVRTFYLYGNCYSIATFTQTDSKTKIDYRNINKSNPNRIASCKLPDEISNKVTLLMKLLKLDTGSIDFIVTPDNDYVFLEVNPVGQFLHVDQLGNYGLIDRIATHLISIAKN